MPVGGARYDKDGNLLTGRKPGIPNKKPTKGWVKVGVMISPEMLDYLNAKMAQGRSKSSIVDDALRLHKGREE